MAGELSFRTSSSDTPAKATWRRERYLAAMALAITPVTVVTTDGPAGRSGQTISAMCSISTEPPTLLVSVNRRSPLCEVIGANGVFAVNLLSPRQAEVSDSFAGRPNDGSPYNFERESWMIRATGSPVLTAATAIFDCELQELVDAATHRIFIGKVLDSYSWPGESLAYRLQRYGSHRPLKTS